MKPYLAALSFTNLSEIAHVMSPGNGKDGYDMLRELVEEFRQSKKPFLAIMGIRHMVTCPICKSSSGEALYHFEDPSQPLNSFNGNTYFTSPVGRYYAVNKSLFHRMLAHGEQMPKELAGLFNDVKK